MIKPFHFLKGYVYDDEYTVPAEPIPPYEPIRPEEISNRHWNILPDFIRSSGDRQVMLAYIEGWESPNDGDAYDLYYDNFNLANAWSMGQVARQRRMNREMLQPTDVENYHTDEFMFIDVTEIRYNRVDGRPYKVMLYRSIEEGDTIEGNRIYSDHPMWNFPDVM